MTSTLGPILAWMVQTTIIALVLIPIVIALCRSVLRNRPAAQHALWAVLLLKFITPAIVVWPWVLPDIRGAVGGLWGRWNSASDAAANDLNIAAASTGTVLVQGSAAQGTLITFDTVALALLVIWIIGCGLVAARSIHRITLQARALSNGSSAPPSLSRTIAEVAGRMNLLPLPAIIVRGIRSPFVWCLGRLRLAWPEGMADEIGARGIDPDSEVRSLSAARPIIAHELAHIRRHDHWLAWIELAASIIWWWNPLFWIVRRNLRATSEMACDALALAAYPEDRCAYAETLLTLSALPSTRAPALGLAATAGTRHSFERRMSMIVSERVTGRHTRPTLLLAGLLAAVSIPAWSFNQTQAEEVTKAQAAKSKRVADAADKARRVEIETELLAQMAILDEKQASLQDQIRGNANKEVLAQLLAARDMVQARLEALEAARVHADELDKRKIDVHRALAELELERASLMEESAGHPDPADLESLDQAHRALIERLHMDVSALDADAKAKYKALAKKPPPLDAETVKRQAVKELLHAMLHPDAQKRYRAAEEAAAADDLKVRMMNAEAHPELLHRYFLGLDKKKQTEEAGSDDAAAADREKMHRYYKALGRHELAEAALTDDAAAAHKEMLHRHLMELGRYAEAKAMLADETAAAADADLHKKRHADMLMYYKKALAEEAAAAGENLTDADRAKLEAHARMLKEELARKAEADAKEKTAKPKN